MKPILHESKSSEGAKPVRLALVEGCGYVQLQAVDRCGGRVANLLTFFGDYVVSEGAAYKLLARCGYDTSFAKWDSDGAMKLG